jgi:hypothetical protein
MIPGKTSPYQAPETQLDGETRTGGFGPRGRPSCTRTGRMRGGVEGRGRGRGMVDVAGRR